MDRTVYFTTPIYYVNAEPHIGHLFTTVLADTLKRYHQLMGDDVFFLTGTDEHGEKIVETAGKSGVKTRDLVDRVSGLFEETWKELGILNDDFVRTTQERHKKYVREVLQQVYDAGDIYFGDYTGLYCVGCERYLVATELEDGKCPDHRVEPREVKEQNYFFKMGKYQERLVEHIEKNPEWIRPERYRNEVLSFLKSPLEDLCISRPKTRLTWGIDLPFDDRFVTYVWFDALLNYVSALKQTKDGDDIYDRFWPHCNHLIAKDILKTHAVYWPTMLMSAKIPLFARIDVHGYWLFGESKMSKSLGNVVRPLVFDRQFGIESLRYFFFREMKFGADAGFTYELFVERYNADLANGLGNLLSRTASIVSKSLKGVIPERPEAGEQEQQLASFASEVAWSYGPDFENRRFHVAIDRIRALLTAADGYINDAKPWKLAKDPEGKRDLKKVLYSSLEVVRIAAILLWPVMPKKCREILGYLGEDRPLDGRVPFEDLIAWGGLRSGYELAQVPKAFPRIDNKKLEQVIGESEKSGIEGVDPHRPPDEAPDEIADDFEPIGEQITIDDFARVDLRVGVVREASMVEKARSLVKLVIDIGEGRTRQVFAGIRDAYPRPEELVGKQVIVVANLKPRKMKFGISEGMILAGVGGKNEERLSIATFQGTVLPGDKVT